MEEHGALQPTDNFIKLIKIIAREESHLIVDKNYRGCSTVMTSELFIYLYTRVRARSKLHI